MCPSFKDTQEAAPDCRDYVSLYGPLWSSGGLASALYIMFLLAICSLLWLALPLLFMLCTA